MAVVAAAVVVAGLVAAAVVEDPADLPEGTPEATVQVFLRAIADRDVDVATDTFAPELRSDCTPEEVRVATRHLSDFSVTHLDTEAVGDEVEVTVRVTEFSGEPPFGGGGYDHEEVFVLRERGGSWRLTDVPWPYVFCPDQP